MRNLAWSYLQSPNCLENFSVSILLMKVSKYQKIVEFGNISTIMKNCKTFYDS